MFPEFARLLPACPSLTPIVGSAKSGLSLCPPWQPHFFQMPTPERFIRLELTLALGPIGKWDHARNVTEPEPDRCGGSSRWRSPCSQLSRWQPYRLV